MKIPCEDCITLSICMNEFIECTKFTLLYRKCSLFRNYYNNPENSFDFVKYEFLTVINMSENKLSRIVWENSNNGWS